MDKRLERRIKELKSFGEKSIGIFGARASGKTMFFTVLYGLSTVKVKSQDFSVVCNNPESREYLRKNYKYLLKGDIPPRTELNEISNISMNYFYRKNNYTLNTIDFAGELISISNDSKIKEKIYEFFLECSGILLFLEPSEDREETKKREQEIKEMIDKLYEQKENGACDIPIGIVLTKWDKISSGKSSLDLEIAKAKDYIKDNPIHNSIYTYAKERFKNIEVFPVSAFGEAKEGYLPPEELNKPFNIFSPLVWAANQKEVIWAEMIKELLTKKVPKEELIDIVDLFIEQVENKELVEEINTEYTLYKKKKRKKALVLFLVLLMGVLGGAYQFLKIKGVM